MELWRLLQKYKPQLAVIVTFTVVFSVFSFVSISSSFARAHAAFLSFRSEGTLTRINGDEYSVRLEGKNVPLSMVDKYHIVLLYDDLKVTTLCTVESLLRALVRGPSTHLNYASHKHVVAEERRNYPSVVFVWVSDLGQQSKAFAELRTMVAKSEVEQMVRGEGEGRKVHLVQKEIDFKDAIAGTEFEEFYKENKGESLGKYGDQNKGNALRLALVQKYGGMYMDADMLVVNDPSGLNDGIARQNAETYNNAAFKFHDAQNSFVKRLAKNFVKNYMGDRWGKQGPQLFTRVAKSACEFQQPKFVCRLKPSEGDGAEEVVEFKDWGVQRFYPLPWYAGDKLDREYHAVVNQYKLNLASERTSVMIHLWHRASKVSEKQLCEKGDAAYKRSFIGHLKSQNCPLITKRVLSSPAKGRRNCDKF